MSVNPNGGPTGPLHSLLVTMIFAAGFSVVAFGRLAAGTYCP